MMLIAFSVHDKSVGAFLPPFYCRSRGEAIRSFTDACGDAKHQFCQHPEDYILFEMFRFDDVSGEVHLPERCAEKVVTALECVKVVNA